jgi:hypothetical protein
MSAAYLKVPLTRGKVALISPEDADRVFAHKWHAVKTKSNYYAGTNLPSSEGRGAILLHRFIAGEPPGLEVDHRNHNGLDCRQGNLREATRLQNGRNLRRKRNNTSGYIGVSWSKVASKWHAYIKVSRKRFHLGLFVDPKDAARAYDAAAIDHFGEWAHLNFPGKSP